VLNKALAILHDEHRSLAAIIHGLRYLVRHAQKTGEMANCKLLWAMLYYIDHFPERLHHPKEETYLFARLQEKTSAADDIIAELRQQHAEGTVHARELERTLGEYEAGQPGGLQSFSNALEAFADATWKHMNLEETVLVPLAKQHLDADDWVAIGAAFGENGDPRFGDAQDQEFRDLFSRIVNLAPPPIGLGPNPQPAS
jgi:hemerythrin-like domain-containing protein